MAHPPLVPLPRRIRVGIDVLCAALLALVVVRSVLVGADTRDLAMMAAVVFAALYATGRALPRVFASTGWIVGLSLVWVVLVVLVPEGAYLVLPLFALYLGVLPAAAGTTAVVVATIVAVVSLGLSGGFTLGGVVGPVLGAAFALLVGAGYRALRREAERSGDLARQLVSTRARLAAVQRELDAQQGAASREAADARSRL